MKLDIRQAIRNAMEAEQASSEFYNSLKAYTEDEKTQAFFDEMKHIELEHKSQIQKLWEAMESSALPEYADRELDLVETVPIWKNVEEISYEEALALARDAEQNAELFYSALSDLFEGEQKEMFLLIAKQEAEHAQWLTNRINTYANIK